MVRFPRLAALVAAVSLAVALPGAVLATDVAETLSVNSSLTVTGIPATVAYGAVDPGSTTPTKSFTTNVSGNSAWELSVTGTDLSAGAGKTIMKGRRDMQLTGFTGGAQTPQLASWTAFDVGSLSTTANPEATGPAGDSSFNTDLRVRVPGSAPAGAYTGTVSFVFSTVAS